MKRDSTEDVAAAKEAFQSGLEKTGNVRTARLNYVGDKGIRVVFMVEVPKLDHLIPIHLMFQARPDWKLQVKTQGARYGARIAKGNFSSE